MVFDALAQRRQFRRVDAIVEARGDGSSNRDLQRGRRRDAPAFRYRGVNQNSQAGRCFRRDQRLHDTNDIGRPTIGLLRGSGKGKVRRVEIPTLSPATGDLTARRGLRLYERERRARERQLEHARAAVVGDPAHDVEPSRGSRDEDGSSGGKETAQARIRRRA